MTRAQAENMANSLGITVWFLGDKITQNYPGAGAERFDPPSGPNKSAHGQFPCAAAERSHAAENKG